MTHTNQAGIPTMADALIAIDAFANRAGRGGKPDVAARLSKMHTAIWHEYCGYSAETKEGRAWHTSEYRKAIEWLGLEGDRDATVAAKPDAEAVHS